MSEFVREVGREETDAWLEVARLRAQQTVLVEIADSAAALVEWVNLVEILRYDDGTKLAALVKLEKALAAADMAMPATLATLDVPPGKYDLRETVDRLRALDVPEEL